jgi:ferredoxin-NADP reductase
MAGTAVLGRLTWQIAQIADIEVETRRVKRVSLSVSGWQGHRAGQHIDVRLTADDGYQAVRSYSIASPPEEEMIVLAIERLDDGEVSPYLVDELRLGDQLEVRGPIGGYFAWDVSEGGPLMLIAGGSGVVPLMAMLRHRVAARSDVPIRLLYSVRSSDDLIFREELDRLEATCDGVTIVRTLTRSHPGGWTGYTRRIDSSLLREVVWGPEERPLIYVCGPTRFVESVSSELVVQGHEPSHVRTERFGPTGR